MKAREFWIQKDNKDIQTYEYFAHETQQYDDDIHAIEYSAYAELKADAQKLVDIGEYVSAQLILYSKDKSWSHLDFALDKMQQALSKWNEKYKGDTK